MNMNFNRNAIEEGAEAGDLILWRDRGQLSA